MPKSAEDLEFEAAGRGSPVGAAALRRPTPSPACSPAPAPAPALSAEAGELWLALHLPTLAFDAVCREGDASQPVAVVEPVRRVQRIVIASRAAHARGVAPGMALAAALTLEPRLDTRNRDTGAERALLERLAAAAGEFTSRVSLEPPDGVLLEVRGSLALFGGVDALCAQVSAACRRVGTRARLALAPTPLAALAGARVSRGRAAAPFRVMHRAQLVGALAPLPLATLRLPQDTLGRLAKMGVNGIGAALRLPRAGFARRFGHETLATLDRLVGREAAPRRAVVPRERYRARGEPSYELTSQPALVAFLAPMLEALEDFLRRRQGSITALECRLHHRGGAVTRCRLRFAQPAFAAAPIGFLLGERLAATTLAAPVTACELVSSRLVPRRSASATLWQPGEHGGGPGSEAPELIERLRARLGEESVYGLCLVPEHRPEAAWRIAEPLVHRNAGAGARQAASAGAAASAVPAIGADRRPLWLLSTPLPLPSPAGGNAWPHYEGPLEKLAGPERIETGWWDDRDVARDYYVVRSGAAALLWIYRERRPPHAWFLHGVFG
ncbi:MAG TPA: DNA polymerase Y family protein [Steroidobacteraceae bacterium]|nr:DNA polymerase Y family protein [Steroidobacteraceae bacterium]